MASRLLLIPALAFSAGASSLRHDPKLSPPLEPKSHDKFFDKDYVADHRPARPRSFDFQHPFPVMQDSADYDTDYVKDENKDGGEWKAQNAYDALRVKRSKTEWAAKRARQEQHEFERQLAENKKNRDAAEAAAREAAKSAEHQHQVADGFAEQAKTLASGSALTNQVDGAVKNVEAQMTNLDACTKALDEAKGKLKALLDEKTARDQMRAEQVEKAEARAVAEEQRAQGLAADAAAKAAEAAQAKQAADAEEKGLADKIAAAKTSAMEKDEEAKLVVSDEDLKAAASRLHKLNLQHTDNNGGVYYLTEPLVAAPSTSDEPAPLSPKAFPAPAPAPDTTEAGPTKSGACARVVSGVALALASAAFLA